MPPRSDLLMKRRATVDLPLLPFLAPRVFTPWPSFGRRAYPGTQTSPENDANAGTHVIELPRSDERSGLRQKRDFTVLRHTTNNSNKPKQRVGNANDEAMKVSETWGNMSITHTESIGDFAELPHRGSSREQFREKYEEIWGTGRIASPNTDLPLEKELGREIPASSDNGRSLSEVQREVAEVVRNQTSDTTFEGCDVVESGKGSSVQNGPVAERVMESETDDSKIRMGKVINYYVAHAHPAAVVHHQIQGTRNKGFRKSLLLDPSEGLQHLKQTKRSTQKAAVREMKEDQKPVAIGRYALSKGFRRPKLPLMQAQKPRTKSVSLSLGQESDPVLYWHTRFAGLRSRQEGTHKLLTSNNRGPEPELQERLIGIHSASSLRTVWEGLSVGRRREIWPSLMLKTLDEQPTRALKLLVATFIEPWPPGYAVSDALDYIISYYLGGRTYQNSKNARDIFRALDQMLGNGTLGHFQLSQKSVYMLVKNLDNALVGLLLQILTESGHPLTKHTLMHFPSKLRLSKGPDERIDILRRLWQAGSDFNSVEVLSVCATLLQRKNRSSEVNHTDSEVFEFMLECGMKPNIIIYNVLLQNAMEAGDPETAWQIHDMMIESGIETDVYTYSLLLTDGKLRGDRLAIKRIMEIAGERNIRNAHIATDILHTIYVFRRSNESSPHEEEQGRFAQPFKRMLTVYRQHFHAEPLGRIIPWLDAMYPSHTSSVNATESVLSPVPDVSLMDPEVPTLVVMLTAFLNEIREAGLAAQLYKHFHELVNTGDPTATALAKSTHVYNVILMTLGRFQETLALCPRLIGEMLSSDVGRSLAKPEFPSSSEELSTLEHSPNLQVYKPKPNVYTWSILLKVFMDHGQPRAAEKVLSMMEERQVWPNQVTWNSLIIGYARMQDMNMTMNAVDRLKRGGFDLDGITMKGLSFFKNRRALVEALKASEGRSIKKRPAAVSKAVTALNQALRMVNEGGADAGLQDSADMDSNSDVKNEKHGVLGGEARPQQGVDWAVDFDVGDIPREEDSEHGSDA